MTFYAYDPTGIDTPPLLENLRGLTGVGAFGITPILIASAASAAAAGGVIAEWLMEEDWSVGQYNDYMRAMDNMIHQLDKLGWSTKCWQNNPAKYQQWRSFAWGEFSKHYRDYGKQSVYLSDSAEKPARRLLRTLGEWTKWFEKTCGAELGPSIVSQQEAAAAEAAAQPSAASEWGGLVKWGAIGLGAIVLLNVVQGIRGAFPRERY